MDFSQLEGKKIVAASDQGDSVTLSFSDGSCVSIASHSQLWLVQIFGPTPKSGKPRKKVVK